MFAAIVETAIISVAAIVIAALATGNMIHARVTTGADKAARKQLKARRVYCVERRFAANGPGETLRQMRDAWEKEITHIDAELLKLAGHISFFEGEDEKQRGEK